MLIAIDGPAASGKGTLAKRLAAHFGLPHLDTGLLYRAVAFAVLEGGGDPRDAAADEAAVLADILRRDARDSARGTAPLTVAPGAQMLDTSDLDVEAAFRAALAVLEGARSGA
jgi:cytidylate kinase